METPVRADLRAITDHPGGNARVCGTDEETIRLEPEFRDSTREWFYWNVTLRAETGGEYRVDFGDHEVVGPRGPAVEREGSWEWLGATARPNATAFTYAFDAGERVRFALAPPYQVADFEAVYENYAAHGRLHRETLTTSEGGRSVPLVRVGSGDRHVVVTCRHHACESTASYALEGLLRELLEGDVLSTDYCVHLVPFVDIDGVERGDQGKHRAPHDHNRDYVEGNAISDSLSPIYRATSAIMTYVRDLEGELVLGLDLHCPFKWGGDNDHPFFVSDPDRADEELLELADWLDRTTTRRQSALDYDATAGGGIHSFDGQAAVAPTFSAFADDAGARLAATLEVPYVGTDADPVTPGSTRALGRALADAVGEWSDESC